MQHIELVSRRIVWLLLALLLLISVSPSAVHAQNAEALPLPIGFHVNGGDLSSLQAAHAAGADHVVVVFSWRNIEPVPNYRYWDRMDGVLRAADFYGLTVIARLDRPPDWALDVRDPTPWRLDAYADFVGRVAARYGDRLAGIILWNEPNLALEWHGQTPDPVAYAAMLAAAYPAAKEEAPNVPVLMAGLASTLGDGVNAINDLAYLEAVYAAGGGGHFDALAAHPYGFGRPPGEAPAADRLNFRRIELQRAIMEANGDAAKPVWITEMGWRTSAPNPADGWQVVTPVEQERFTLQALADAAAAYPWLERTTLWEISAGRDRYGYGIWHGPGHVAPLYATLVDVADGASPVSAALRQEIDILAADTIVRLGDIGTLHPHWVHLYEGGENLSPRWRGHFFLSQAEAERPYDLLLETMQIDQPTNRVRINGRDAGWLAARARPDPTSTWAQQRLHIAADLLQPGVNTLTIASGLRNPVRQYAWWRQENLQLRDIRLVAVDSPEESDASPDAWRTLPGPSGWAEPNRVRAFLRADGSQEVWVTGNRLGQLWQQNSPPDATAISVHNVAGDYAGRTFTDVLAQPDGVLVATDRGLLQRESLTEAWRAPPGAPDAYAYVVTAWDDGFAAGFEDQGVWHAPTGGEAWRLLGLPGLTVLDLTTMADDTLVAATDYGVYLYRDRSWTRLPDLPASGAGESDDPAADRFMTRLALGENDVLVVRNQDRLWRRAGAGWQPFGPDALSDEIYSVINCCGDATLIGTDQQGLWGLNDAGSWVRVDDGFFNRRKITGGVVLPGRTLIATENGLFVSPDLGRWRPVSGLTPTVTDLLIDPQDPARWLAGTPAGIYRSEDGGESWTLITPPWDVWDMAFGSNGRLFVARGNGLVWTDDVGASTVTWTQSDGMEGVTFFHIAPDPNDPTRVWVGSWGNDIGISTDGGATLRSLHNGLEALSVLSILWHATPGQITIGTIEGLYRSDDDGATWFKLPGALQSQTVYALRQTDDGTIFAGAADGLWQSSDYGVNWIRVGGVPEATVLRLGAAVSSENTRLLWAATEGAGLWTSADGGLTWVEAGLPDRSVYAVVWQADSAIVATSEGLLTTP